MESFFYLSVNLIKQSRPNLYSYFIKNNIVRFGYINGNIMPDNFFLSLKGEYHLIIDNYKFSNSYLNASDEVILLSFIDICKNDTIYTFQCYLSSINLQFPDHIKQQVLNYLILK